jgi:hypothetical protein
MREANILKDNLPLTHTLRLRCFEVLLSCYRHTNNHEMFMTTFRDTLEYV